MLSHDYTDGRLTYPANWDEEIDKCMEIEGAARLTMRLEMTINKHEDLLSTIQKQFRKSVKIEDFTFEKFNVSFDSWSVVEYMPDDFARFVVHLNVDAETFVEWSCTLNRDEYGVDGYEGDTERFDTEIDEELQSLNFDEPQKFIKSTCPFIRVTNVGYENWSYRTTHIS